MFFNGLGLVVVVYVSGLLSLLGDYRVELYLLLGIILGGFLFPLLGWALLVRVRHPLVWGLLIAAASAIGLTAANEAYPLFAGTDLFARSFFATAVGVPVAIALLPGITVKVRSRRAAIWALGLGLGPIILGIIDSLIYVALGFEGFAFIVAETEGIAAVLLLIGFLLAFRRSSATGSAGGTSDHASGPTGPSRSRVSSSSSSSPSSDGNAPGLGAEIEGAHSPVRARAVGLVGAGRPSRRGAGGPPTRSLARLVAAVVVLAILVDLPLGGAGAPAGTGAAPSVLSAPSARTPIQHVVMIIMENHAFDNFFGLYPFEPGTNAAYPGITVPNNLANSSRWSCTGGAGPVPGSSTGCSASGIDLVPNGTWNTVNPYEGYSPYHIDWDQGKMDGWLSPGGSGPQSLATFGVDQMAPEWVMAQEYAMGDSYYSPVMSETTPNRLYSIAGFSPVSNDYGPPPYIPFDQTIFGEMQASGLSWGYYLQDPSAGLGTLDFVSGLSVGTPQIQTYGDFESQAGAGTLPALSWLMPTDGGLSDQYSQGPPGNVLQGEMWILYMLHVIMTSPDWSSTAVILTYDEAGGYYDHVAPPSLDGEQLGVRIPLIVLSPYAKEDYVSHTVMNHASWLGFVDYNWGLPALNSFVADSILPLDLFDFTQAPRAPIALTAAQGFPTPSTIPFSLPTSPDLASLFPQPFQIPLSNLTYARTGSSSTTMAQLGGGVYVTADTAITPWYVSVPFLSWVFLLEISALMGFFPLVRLLRARREAASRGHPRP